MKRSRRFIALLLGLTIAVASLGLGGCTKSDVIILSIYDENSTGGGYIAGWFADEVRERFGIQIKYENANSQGFVAYVEAETLGDIVIFNSISHYRLARNAGVLMEWNEENVLEEFGSTLAKEQRLSLAKNQIENNCSGIYGIYSNVTNTEDMYTTPQVIYLNNAYYEAVGSPEIADLSALTAVLQEMVALAQKDHEATVYALSSYKDDDETYPAIVEDLLAVYGYETFGLGIYNPATDDYREIIDEDGLYADILHYYNDLYEKGLIDPDSLYQTADNAALNYAKGLALMSFSELDGFIPVAIGDATPNVFQIDPAGEGSIISIAANTAYPDYCMQLIEWLYSEEGYLTYNYGPKDVCWVYDTDGTPRLTEFGYLCLTDGANAVMTGTYSGFFLDGVSQLNTDTLNFNAPLPSLSGQRTDVTFNYRTWPASAECGYLEDTSASLSAAWQAQKGVSSTAEYLASFRANRLGPNSFASEEMITEVALPYAQVTAVFKVYSTNLIYADEDADFDETFKTMVESATAYRYDIAEAFWDTQLTAYRALFAK